MGLLTFDELRSRGNIAKSATGLTKTAKQVIADSKQTALDSQFDIFLSHASIDIDDILLLRELLVGSGFSVYVDRFEDPDLDRSKVTAATAARLRLRMKNSHSLLYAFSVGSRQSVWMPWELGFFDGSKSRAAVFPLVTSSTTAFDGLEYLGLYPYVTHELTNRIPASRELWINAAPNTYVELRRWLSGTEPTLRG